MLFVLSSHCLPACLAPPAMRGWGDLRRLWLVALLSLNDHPWPHCEDGGHMDPAGAPTAPFLDLGGPAPANFIPTPTTSSPLPLTQPGTFLGGAPARRVCLGQVSAALLSGPECRAGQQERVTGTLTSSRNGADGTSWKRPGRACHRRHLGCWRKGGRDGTWSGRREGWSSGQVTACA